MYMADMDTVDMVTVMVMAAVVVEHTDMETDMDEETGTDKATEMNMVTEDMVTANNTVIMLRLHW